jgi:peroxiredoxin (alkyl hydroperoxide reductase subunit C)
VDGFVSNLLFDFENWRREMSVLVGKQAPDFTVPAVLGDGQIVDSFSFSDATQGKYAVVFLYTRDFKFFFPR